MPDRKGTDTHVEAPTTGSHRSAARPRRRLFGRRRRRRRRVRHHDHGSRSRRRWCDGGTGETITIVASVPPTDHGWLGQIAAKAQEAADSHDDVEFRLLEAADADSQASQIETVINENPDVIVVLPYDGDQLTPIAEAAMEAGIPVVNVDRLFATPEAARATILGDNYAIGANAATFLAEQLDCEGNVVEIQGIAGISVTEDRSAGLRRHHRGALR